MTIKQAAYLVWDITCDAVLSIWSVRPLRYIVLGLGLLLLILGIFDSCRQRSIEKKLERIEANITEKRIEANILTNQKNAVEIEVKKNETNTNLAERNVDASRDRDSNLFPTGENRRRYCKQFPLDSLCVEYCKTHNCY